MENIVQDINTQRLLLRKLKYDDAEDLFLYASDERISEFMNFDKMDSRNEAHMFIDNILAGYDTGDVVEWAIEYKPDKRMIGAVYFCNIDRINRFGEIGFIISENYKGLGLATEALKAVISFAFDYMDLNRVEGMHFPGNTGSKRVMEKAGMKFEGLLRQRFYTKGRFFDGFLYGICKSDIE